MNCQLTLRYDPAAPRPACAWFVPGADAEAWLAALSALAIDSFDVRLLIVPTSTSDRRPLGALIIGGLATAKELAQMAAGASTDMRQAPLACAYGCIADRLYLPVDGIVSPPVDDGELREMLAEDQLYVWHPVAGLVALSPEDCISPTNLLVAPAESLSDWDHAAPGVAFNTRLLSLSATVTPQLNELIEQGRGDIGSQVDDLSTLPATPEESRGSLLAGARRGLTALVARFALWLSQLGSGQSKQPAAKQAAAQKAASRRRLVRWLIAAFMCAFVAGLIFSLWSPPRGPINTLPPTPQAPWNPQPHSPSTGPVSSPPSTPLTHNPVAPNSTLITFLVFGTIGLVVIVASLVRKMLSWKRGDVLVFLIAMAAFVAIINGVRFPPNAIDLIAASLFAAIIAGVIWRGLFPPASASGVAAQRRPTAPASNRASSRPTGWLARLGAWAAGKLQQSREALQNMRNREIERLVRTLDADPDKGLKFALPLTGDAFRGTGVGGSQLTQRNVNFNSRGSGGPGAYWNVRDELRRRLTEQYRALANREISLGRHRRAAYILAQLLGDWHGAARTLADGGHHREAAVVYDERLRRPLDAANCLEKGGLLSEAIVIYDRLGQFEKVGDLYTMLDQPDEAAQAFRRAVDSRRQARDRLGAAKLLEEKLIEPEEAWQELVGGWPDSSQGELCLRAAFVWTQRRQKPDRANWLLRDAATRSESAEQAVSFARIAATIANEYPQAPVRSLAAESVLKIASARLREAKNEELTGLTAAVRQLGPSDRLLGRDCDRFVRDRIERNQTISVIAGNFGVRVEDSRRLRLNREIKLPFGNVRACVASDLTFYAAGWRDCELVLIRGNWQGSVQYPGDAPWKFPKAVSDAILIAVEPTQEAKLVVHALGQEPATYQRNFPPTNQLRQSVSAGACGIVSSNTLGVCPGGRTHVVDIENSAIVVRTYYASGFGLAQTASYEWIDAYEQASESWSWPNAREIKILPRCEREGAHYFGILGCIFAGRGAKLVKLTDCERPILRLVVSPAHTTPRIVAALDRGVRLLWGITPGSPATHFAHDMIAPQVMIHRDGWTIAADQSGCEIYQIVRGKLQLHLTDKWPDRGPPVALLPMPVPNCFAVCFESGQILQYQIPRASG